MNEAINDYAIKSKNQLAGLRRLVSLALVTGLAIGAAGVAAAEGVSSLLDSIPVSKVNQHNPLDNMKHQAPDIPSNTTSTTLLPTTSTLVLVPRFTPPSLVISRDN